MDARDQSCGPILVADADRQARLAICHVLETVGLTTSQAGSGEVALQKARDEHPVLAILDVDVPLLSGYEVCRQLKAEFGVRIAVVFVSADRIEPRDRVAGLYIGGDDYLPKPFDPGELVARIRRLLVNTLAEVESPLGAAALTRREREVLVLLAQGMSQTAIAGELMISSKTVGNHLHNVLAKLGAHSRAEAVSLAYRHSVV